MLQLTIVVLAGAVMFFVFKGRKVESAEGNFSGAIVAVAVLGIALGALASVTPTVLPFTSSFAENVMEVKYEGVKVGSGTVTGTKNSGTSVSVSASGASASASASTSSLKPSTEGMRQMEKHFSTITYVKGTQTFTFPKVGDGWFWNVIDPGLSATVGQKVKSDEYTLADPSAGTPVLYLARVVKGVTEYGDKRPFPIP